MFPNLGELQKMGEEAGGVLARIATALERSADIAGAELTKEVECPHYVTNSVSGKVQRCTLDAGHHFSRQDHIGI